MSAEKDNLKAYAAKALAAHRQAGLIGEEVLDTLAHDPKRREIMKQVLIEDGEFSETKS